MLRLSLQASYRLTRGLSPYLYATWFVVIMRVHLQNDKRVWKGLQNVVLLPLPENIFLLTTVLKSALTFLQLVVPMRKFAIDERSARLEIWKGVEPPHSRRIPLKERRRHPSS